MPDQSSLPGEEPVSSFEALLSVVPEDLPNKYKSLTKGARAGNSAPIAFGGYVQALCVSAAAATVPAGFGLHYFSGIFLGPTSTTQPVFLTVEHIRSTRTFQTRGIVVEQADSKKEKRKIFSAQVDFMTSSEPESMIFHVSPRISYSKPDACPEYIKHLEKRVADGSLPSKLLHAYQKNFGLFELVAEQRLCPEGIGFQNLCGVDRNAKTTQDHKSLTDKTTGWWVRSKLPFSEYPDGSAMHKAALVFLMDAATSFIPLTHTHRFFESIAACSSLDVSVRFRTSNFRIDQWMLLELYTEAGGEGRTVAVSKAWTEDGALVATASQNGILRFPPGKNMGVKL